MNTDAGLILKLFTAPASEPITTNEAKAHLRIDASDEDNLITGYITAARQLCELYARRALVTQTWDLSLEQWPGCDQIELPRPPLQSVTSISYIDSNGATSTLASSSYIVDTASEPGRVILAYGATWPTVTLRPGPAITVRYVAGYGAAAAVPELYKQALKLIVGHFFENREQVVLQPGLTVAQLPMAAQALLMVDRGSW
jgi:uncharacterized phiE125 gp8 family phage protein